jgi:prefoldin subunit 5
MSFEEAIKTIIELNEEIKAVKILMGCIERNTDKIESENAEMSSCLRAIKKINKGKNEAIDSLCEKENAE